MGWRSQHDPGFSYAGSSHSASLWMRYLRKEDGMKGKKHVGPFNGSAEELETLTQCLESMKSNERDGRVW